MSSVNASLPTSPLDAERRAHDPSMEEILASIRRIIADDESLPVLRDDEHGEEASSSEPLAAQAVEEAREEPLQVSTDHRKGEAESVKPREDRWPRAIPTLPQTPPRRPDPHPEGERRWTSPTPVRSIRSDYPTPGPLRTEPSFAPTPSSNASAPSTPREGEGAPESRSYSTSYPAPAATLEPRQTLVSLDAAATVSAHFQALAETTVMQDSDFLNRCAQEALRPMLKQWLDNNLPVLVERLVREEIERVARGRR